MIYMTRFDPASPGKEVQGVSLDSGLASLDMVAAVFGTGYVHRGPRNIIYPDGVAFSDFPFAIDAPNVGAVETAQLYPRY